MKKKLPSALIVTVVLTMIVCLITLFINSTLISSFDTWTYKSITLKMSPQLTFIMMCITETGSKITVVILCLSLFLFNRTRKEWAIPVTFNVVSATIVNLFLKLLFTRERPNILQLVTESNYSFPSGHSMINMAFYMMILLLTHKYVKSKKLRMWITIFCIVIPITIGISRIYLGVHYATDVIAGWGFGVLISLINYNILERWLKSNNN